MESALISGLDISLKNSGKIEFLKKSYLKKTTLSCSYTVSTFYKMEQFNSVTM